MPVGPATGTGFFTASLSRTLSTQRKSYDALQMQLTTGKRSMDFAGLGSDRTVSLALNSKMAQLNTFNTSNETVNLRLQLMNNSVTRMAALGREVKADADPGNFDIISNGQTAAQKAARLRVEEMTELLNSNLGGRYLFSGTTTDQRPVEDVPKILDGDGARAGFTQIVNERRAADLGTGGLGRLTAPTATANVVSVAEDGTHPFGFKLTSATPQSPGWATVTGPAGAPPSIDVSVDALPAQNDAIRFTLAMPDGTSKDITLTATTEDPPGTNQFLIGADEDETAANLRAALQTGIEKAAATDLRAASAVQAGNDFFTSNPPQRVSGVPLETATALVDGTAADTVSWYTGDPSTGSARQSATARIDTGVNIAYGARANEDAFTNTLKDMAVYATVTFDTNDANALDFHTQLAIRTRSNLDAQPGQSKPETVAVEFGLASKQMEAAKTRHNAALGVIQKTLADKEGIMQEEVGAKILTLQTRMQASYQVTAIMADLQLVNFLR
jgi:flagellar hook-associated protein 3 FlgL